MNFEETVALYIKGRDKIEDLEREHKERMKPLKDGLATLNTSLLGFLTAAGTDQMKVRGVGTVYTKKVHSVSVKDWSITLPWILTEHKFQFLNAAVNKSAVVEMAEKTGELPPGVNFSTMIDVGIRRD